MVKDKFCSSSCGILQPGLDEFNSPQPGLNLRELFNKRGPRMLWCEDSNSLSQLVHHQEIGQSKCYRRDRFCNRASTGAGEKFPERRRSIDCALCSNNHDGIGSDRMLDFHSRLT